jgi:tRNA threonylcarbamoyladenosine biosynthesis protein TsaB
MQLAIDCASDEPGVALAVDGVIGMIATWRTERNHSVELLPNIDRLLREAERTKEDISAVLIDLGPGGYGALRVGVSTAKALAHGLGVPASGVGRLELDAYGVVAEAADRRIVPVHRAGRGDLAWAAYRLQEDAWAEEIPPRITKAAELHATLHTGDALVGDVDEALGEVAQGAGAVVLAARAHRVVALAALGHQRLAAGRADDPAALVPLYLRAPAIGPQ